MLCRLAPLVTTLALLSGLLISSPAHAEGQALDLTAPSRLRLDEPTTLTAHLTEAGAPVADTVVVFQRQNGSSWGDVGRIRTGPLGGAALTRATVLGDAVFRAVVPATADHPVLVSAPVTVTGYRLSSTLSLTAPSWTVVDEQSRGLTGTWSASTGEPISGPVTLWSNPRTGVWTKVVTRTTGPKGGALFVVRPRRDTYYRLTGPTASWWTGATSATKFLDNLPPGVPVDYPAAAPRPKALPAQAHAVGAGANATVSRLSDAVWRSMVGRSWRSGCPVGRASLRIIRVNYWDFAGYRRRGEMVVRDAIASRAAAALRDMYNGKYPLRAMYRVDRFGYSSRVHGADDYAAMQHDNTSAFNCRWVTGSNGIQSPHSYGRAIDLNTWENPYNSAKGIVPNTWWYNRSHPRIAWRTTRHPVVRIWLNHGFRWTYRVQDSQHMDGRRMPVEGTFTG